MARPNITVVVNDDSFIVPNTERGSFTVAGMISHGGLIQAMGTTAEVKSGVMQVGSLNDLIARLNSKETLSGQNKHYNQGVAIDGAITGDDLTERPFYQSLINGYSGGTIKQTGGNFFAGGTYARWPLGPTGAWRTEWWSAHNYLQYGGVLIVGGTGSIDYLTMTNSSTPLHNTSIPLDLVFAGATTSAANAAATSIATTRMDCIAVTTAEGDVGNPALADGVISDEFNVSVYGNKKHLDISRGLRNDSLDDLITSHLAPDVAGCMARTDRIADSWWSPAGFKRGQILDVVRLIDNPTEQQMDTMYDLKINPVVTYPGEGTVLFGDKTLGSETSTLSRINVSRLFIYLKKTIGASARSLLFELNDWETRTSFINAVTPVLENISARRGIYDYRVVCDETNNTSSIIDSNQFVADIYIKPAKSINFIQIRFTNKNTEDQLS